MNRAIQFVALVWLGAAVAAGADQNKAAPKKQPAGEPVLPPSGGGGVPKGGGKMGNPDNPVDRLLRMTPEQRERALEKLPAQQQANIRKRLENFDRLPPAQKERQLQRLNELWSLPPDKHELVAQQIKAFDALPEDRRVLVRQAYQRLSRLSADDRTALLAKPAFRGRFTPAELEILTVLPQYYPAPGAAPNK